MAGDNPHAQPHEPVVPLVARAAGKLQWRDRAGYSPAARRERAVGRTRIILGLLTAWLLAAPLVAAFHVSRLPDIISFALRKFHVVEDDSSRRGAILDRNGVTLAIDVHQTDLVFYPRWHEWKGYRLPFAHDRERGAPEPPRLTPDEVIALNAERLAAITGGSAAELRARMTGTKGQVTVLRDVPREQRLAITKALRASKRAERLFGLHLQDSYRRHHPGGAVAGALLGRSGAGAAVGSANWQGNVEATHDTLLSGTKLETRRTESRDGQQLLLGSRPDRESHAGVSLELTIDRRIQAITEDLLAGAVKDADAEYAMAVVMDIPTGDILALAQAPGLDPDDSKVEPRGGWRNRPIQDQFEPGSTLKVLTYAAALAEGRVTPNEMFATAGGLAVPGKLIRDAHPHGDMTAAQAIQYSSNVAIGKIALRLGKVKLHQHLSAFGLGKATDVGLIDEIGGSMRPGETWLPVNLANIAFGQGVAVTALQLTNAFAVIGREGRWLRPRLLRAKVAADGTRTEMPPSPAKRVLAASVAKQVLEAMALVCGPGGTARRARLPDYKMTGKTGTAQQYDPKGGYSATHWIASFIGLVPLEQPRLAIFVAVDTPRKVGPGGVIIRTGGAIAAPVVREIAQFALPLLGVPKSPGAPYLDSDDPIAAKARAERLAASGVSAPAPGLDAPPGASPPAGDDDAPPPARVSGASSVPLVAGRREAAPEVAAPTVVIDPGRVVVPDVAGMTVRKAVAALGAAGLLLAPQGHGVARSQQPAAGQEIARGARVEVRFAPVAEAAADRERP